MYQEITNDTKMGQHIMTKTILECLQQNELSPEWAPNADTDNRDILNSLKEQMTIRWKHIYYGRMARSWTKISTQHPSTTNNNKELSAGDGWTRRIIRIIWNTFLRLWTNRNGIIYNDQLQTQQDRQRECLATQVELCYSQRHDISISDQNKIFCKEQDQLMQQDARYIKAWLKLSKRIIRTNKTENKKRTREKDMMEQYFKWHPPPQKSRRRDKKVRTHHKHDLHPD
jgi:hypothetical protein